MKWACYLKLRVRPKGKKAYQKKNTFIEKNLRKERTRLAAVKNKKNTNT